MTRQPDDCCGNCIFKRAAVGQDGKVDLAQPGQCKLNPPAIFMVPKPTEPGFAFAAIRPSVASVDWCGKHERRE